MPKDPPPALDVARHALFLDLDGTLVDIQERPHAVTSSVELRDLLQRVKLAMNGAVALITGRTLGEADRILHGALDNVAGVHGYEIQRGAKIVRDGVPLSTIQDAAVDIRHLLQEHALPALVEDKRASLALHYRHQPDAGPQLLRIATDIARRHGLRVLQGKMVVEIVASSRTKGDALASFMSSPPFASRTPVMLGDDLTDEDAFLAAKRFGGLGVLIGMPRQSAASCILAGPSAVQDWLASPFADEIFT